MKSSQGQPHIQMMVAKLAMRQEGRLLDSLDSRLLRCLFSIFFANKFSLLLMLPFSSAIRLSQPILNKQVDVLAMKT